jgi:hypothetical protein
MQYQRDRMLVYCGDLLNASCIWIDAKPFPVPTAGIGTLAERGAAWLFVRYLVDRYASGPARAQWDTLTRSLVGTASTGSQNIAALTGEPFATVVGRWALANWMTDNGGAPPELQYDSWALHAVFSSLHTQRPSKFPNFYPLNPRCDRGPRRGSQQHAARRLGVYVRATQTAGDPGFTLQLTTPAGALINQAYVPRLNVIRLQ